MPLSFSTDDATGNIASDTDDTWVRCENLFTGELQITLKDETGTLLQLADANDWYMMIQVRFDDDCNCNNH